MTQRSFNQQLTFGHMPQRAVALALASLMLVGCSSNRSDQEAIPEQAPPLLEQSPPPVEQLTPADCSLRYVQPGLNFSEGNSGKISEDLAVLTSLEQGSGEIRLRDIVTAGRIVKDSYQDPLYAEAMLEARETIASGTTVSVEEFLQTPVTQPLMCDPNHIEKVASSDQLSRTASLSQSITRQLGNRLGANASRLSREAYNVFQREVDQLRERAEQAETTPNN